ncbi:T9SS type A sorting domain-containing protein [bacterium]|nr:T9SS type A sorting domain-containing protein [bacterium]
MRKYFLYPLSLFFFILTNSNIQAAPLIGNYVIGAGQTYTSINSAIDAIESEGISGHVSFKIASGTYTITSYLENLTGTSEAATVTFESQTGNPSDVVLQSTSSYLLYLRNISFFRFKNLTLTQNTTTRTVYINGDVNDVKFENCDLYGFNTTSSSSSYSVFYITGNNKNISIQNCRFHRGSYGIYLRSETQNLSILDNDFGSNLYYLMRLQNFSGLEIIGNTSSDSRSTSIYLYDGTDVRISNNQFIADANLLNMYSISTDEMENNLIFNNIFGSTNYSTAVYFNSYCSNIEFYHNTCYSDNYAINIGNGGTNLKIKNNLFYIENCTSIARYYGNYIDCEIDYNAYATGYPNCSYLQSDYGSVTLQEFSDYTGFDQNSYMGDPGFSNYPSSLLPEYGMFSDFCLPLDGLDTDYNDNPRSGDLVDPGAFVFNPSVSVDVAVLKLMGTQVPNCDNNSNISAKIKNVGTSQVDSIRLKISFNNTVKHISYEQTLDEGQTIILDLGSLDFDGINDSISVELVAVDGVQDMVSSNDYIYKYHIYEPVSGTIKLGANDTFENAESIFEQLQFGGICGPTTIEFQPGTYEYDFSFNLDYLPGNSMQNSLTFTSAGGNPEDVILKPTEDYSIFYLAHVEALNFEGLTIDLLSNDACGNWLYLSGTTTNLNVSKMKVKGDSSRCANVFEFSSGLPSISITNSEFENFQQLFNVSSNNNTEGEINISNNIIKNIEYGANISSYKTVHILNNVFENDTSMESLYIDYCSDIEISNNSFYCSGNNDRTLVYISGFDSELESKVRFVNNVLAVDGSAEYLLQYGDLRNTLVANNTFRSNSIVKNYTLVHLSSEITNSSFVNNIIYSNDDEEELIFSYDEDNVQDYNNYFNHGGPLLNFNGSIYSDIDILKSENQIEQHSLSIDPGFNENSLFHVCNSDLDNTGLPINGLRADLDGDPRNSGSMDIGADEFSISGKDFLVTDNASLCEGQAVLKASPNADSYLWSTGATTQSISVTEVGTYTVEVEGYCSMNGSDTAIVDDYQINAHFSFLNVYGRSIHLKEECVGNPHSYFWDFGDGTTSMEKNPSHEFDAFGVYTVSLTVTSDCGTSTFVDSVSTFKVNIPELAKLNVAVYPIPADDYIKVDFGTETNSKLTLRLIDQQGQEIYTNTSQVSDRSISINTSDLAAGLYILSISNGEAISNIRIVIE